jgi:hypothetical protein
MVVGHYLPWPIEALNSTGPAEQMPTRNKQIQPKNINIHNMGLFEKIKNAWEKWIPNLKLRRIFKVFFFFEPF